MISHKTLFTRVSIVPSGQDNHHSSRVEYVALAPDCCFLLMLTPGGNNDGSSNWDPATYLEL